MHVQHVELACTEQSPGPPPRARVDAERRFGVANDERHAAAERQFVRPERCGRRAEDADIVAKTPKRRRLSADVRVDAARSSEVVRGADPDAKRPLGPIAVHEREDEELDRCSKIAQDGRESALDRLAVRCVGRQRGHEQPMRAAEVVVRQRRNPVVQRVVAQADGCDERPEGVSAMRSQATRQRRWRDRARVEQLFVHRQLVVSRCRSGARQASAPR